METKTYQAYGLAFNSFDEVKDYADQNDLIINNQTECNFGNKIIVFVDIIGKE